MIKFFRRIRHQMLSKNKLSKYLIYALGEIVLVVVGILIALSINNWNDYRKDRIAENELYKTLIRSLENDLKDAHSKIVIIDSALIGQKIFITQSLEDARSRLTENEFFDLLTSVGNTSVSFVPNISLYNKISQNKQIDLIQSEELQMKIIELYEVHYWEYKDLDAALESQAQSGLISNFFGNIAHMSIQGDWKLDLASFGQHYDELSKECRRLYFLSVSTQKSMINCKNKIESLLQLLNEELNK